MTPHVRLVVHVSEDMSVSIWAEGVHVSVKSVHLHGLHRSMYTKTADG